MNNKIDLEINDSGVAFLRMQDIEGKNTFSSEFVSELQLRLSKLDNSAIKVCVIIGMEDVFSGGGDKETLISLAEGRLKPYDLVLARTLIEVPVPTISAMAGHAVGGGLVFGLSCDIALLGRESRYGCNFMDLGFTPGMGTTRLLGLAFGEYVAAEMMFGAQYFLGKHFENRGSINYILPKKDVVSKATQIAERIAEKPAYALRMLKQTLSLPRKKLFEEARTLEAIMHSACFAQPETRNLIKENYLSPNGKSNA